MFRLAQSMFMSMLFQQELTMATPLARLVGGSMSSTPVLKERRNPILTLRWEPPLRLAVLLVLRPQVLPFRRELRERHRAQRNNDNKQTSVTSRGERRTRALALQLSRKWLRTPSPQSRYNHLLEKTSPSHNLQGSCLRHRPQATDHLILQDLFLRRFSVYTAGSTVKWNSINFISNTIT